MQRWARDSRAHNGTRRRHECSSLQLIGPTIPVEEIGFSRFADRTLEKWDYRKLTPSKRTNPSAFRRKGSSHRMTRAGAQSAATAPRRLPTLGIAIRRGQHDGQIRHRANL